MACKSFFASQNFPTTSFNLQEVQNAVFAQGIGCINTNLLSCSTVCNDLTKSETACYSCLSQAPSCPPQSCRGVQTGNCASDPNGACCPNKALGCCPYAQQAVECGTCVSKNGGQTSDDFTACLQTKGVSHTVLIVIIVCSVIVVIIIIAAVVIALKVKKSNQAKQSLIDSLPTNTDPRIVQEMQGINSANIDSKVFSDVAQKLSQKKLQKIPQPQNNQVSESPDDDSLFS